MEHGKPGRNSFKMKTENKPIAVSMDPDLLQAVDEMAQATHQNRSAMMRQALRAGLSKITGKTLGAPGSSRLWAHVSGPCVEIRTVTALGAPAVVRFLQEKHGEGERFWMEILDINGSMLAIVDAIPILEGIEAFKKAGFSWFSPAKNHSGFCASCGNPIPQNEIGCSRCKAGSGP